MVPMQRELKPGQLKILKAVATLLENPSVKLTIAEVAKEVGVTDAAIYRHYRSKEQIFQALVDYLELNFLSPLHEVSTGGGEVITQLKSLFEQYNTFFASHPGLARLFFGHGAHEGTGLGGRLQHLHAKVRSQVAEILMRAAEQQRLRSDMGADQATELFYGLLTAAASAAIFNLPQLDVTKRWQAFQHSVMV
jgi:TetR/AcrR family transcriptional regulator